MREVLLTLGAIATPFVMVLGAYVGYLTYKANKVAATRAAKVSEVEVSLKSLSAALDRSDKEREELAIELAAEKAQVKELRAEIRSMRDEFRLKLNEHKRECADRVALLSEQLRSAGLTPNPEALK